MKKIDYEELEDKVYGKRLQGKSEAGYKMAAIFTLIAAGAALGIVLILGAIKLISILFE